MSLAPGTQLGPFEIQSLLGAGGMGEVYRARDTRLDRTVAIKLLPSELAANSESRQRLEREARSISKLSHPHICALYDIGHQDGTDFLVMEYVEGETLEQRLSKGPLSIEQVLKTAIEICAALDMAHQQGVIHRDLKPSNIMLTKAGAKLLDFGLAKLLHLSSAVELALTEITADRKLTAEGVLVGTLQYMAPEQLEGKDADARTDIFALGEIAFEMATGRPPFNGKSKASLIAAILSSEPPDITTLQPMIPAALNRVVKTCLLKDPADRFQTAHDLKLQLEWITDAGSQAVLPAPVLARRKRLVQVAWGLGVLLPILAVFATRFYFHFSEEKRAPIVAFLPPPDRATIEFAGDTAGPPVISPNGRFIAFAAASLGTTKLWLRALDAEKAQPLADTEGASFPFWSADSRSIGFFAHGKLERIDVGGGSPMSLCDAPLGRGGAWNKDGVIVFAPEFRSGLFRVSASGGIPVEVTRVDSSKHSTHRWPFFLPDGKHFLYLALNHIAPAGENTAVYVASLDGKENRVLVHSKASAIYASGYLLFLRGNTLMAQPFDAGRLELTGEPVPVAANIQSDPGTWRPVFSASDSGLLIYEGTESNGTQLTWFDRSGKRIGTLGDREHYGSLRISPRGDKVAVELGEPSDIWIYDAVRGMRTRLTFNPAQDATAVWSPDESQIVFTSQKNGHPNLYRKAINGTGPEELLLASDAVKEAQDWSADGRFLIYMQSGAGSLGQLWILPLFGDRKPVPFVKSAFFDTSGTFSHDGRWVAYESDESGRSEVYVMPFRALSSGESAGSSTGKWQVSTSGGILPIWRRDGRELLYIEPGYQAPFSGRIEVPGAKLMAVQVSTTGSEFKIGKARPLFTIPPGTGLDATSDGQRFLIEALDERSSAPLTLLVNWTAKLKL